MSSDITQISQRILNNMKAARNGSVVESAEGQPDRRREEFVRASESSDNSEKNGRNGTEPRVQADRP